MSLGVLEYFSVTNTMTKTNACIHEIVKYSRKNGRVQAKYI